MASQRRGKRSRPRPRARTGARSPAAVDDVFPMDGTVESYVAYYRLHGAISSDEGHVMWRALALLAGDAAVRELLAIIRRDKWVVWDSGDPTEEDRQLRARRRRARRRARALF